MKNNNLKLPNNFLLGGSNSGPQTEGSFDKNNDNIFEYWYKNEPESFYDQVGPNITSNLYNTYKEDIKMMSKAGIKIYRTSIQWTRLIKNLKTFEVDKKAVEFYKNYFLELKQNGIFVIVNLFHFDIPIEEHFKGGWENKEVTDSFAKYAKVCFEEFGNLVDYWATMNEPIVVSESFYTHDFWWPRCNDFKRGVQVSFNLLLASAKAIREFKQIFKNDKNKKISIILNLSPAIPKDDQLENLLAAEKSNLFSTKFFMDIAIKGNFPIELQEEMSKMNCLPDFNENDLKILKNNTIDYLGVNYYAPRRVQKPLLENKEKIGMSRFFDSYNMPTAKINKSRGWEIFPEGLSDISKMIKEEYENILWYVSENGMGVHGEENFIENNMVQDDYRIEFIRDHLTVLAKEIENGANCFAYCIWTPIDCWSWANAYKNRYGLIRVDLETQVRTFKKSASYFKKVSDTKEIN